MTAGFQAQSYQSSRHNLDVPRYSNQTALRCAVQARSQQSSRLRLEVLRDSNQSKSLITNQIPSIDPSVPYPNRCRYLLSAFSHVPRSVHKPSVNIQTHTQIGTETLCQHSATCPNRCTNPLPRFSPKPISVQESTVNIACGILLTCSM